MRRAGRAAAATLAAIAARIAPGISTGDIDAWVREDTRRRGGRPSQLGFHGFPAAVCTSRNAVVCHGIPNRRERLAAGDIINVDVTTELGGFHGDTSATLFVGAPSAEARHVVETARRCRDAGIAAVRAGRAAGRHRRRHRGAGRAARAAASCARSAGTASAAPCTRRRPSPTSARAATGLRLREGMAITIEPMINLGPARGASAGRRLDDRHRRRLAVGPVRAHGAGRARRVRGPHPPLTPIAKKRAPVSIRPAVVRRPGRRRQEP